MKIFAHILLLYFSLGACLPKGDFSQLLKLNDLQQHYVLHQNEAIAANTSISFSDFLYLHFVDSNQHHHDEGNHDNLPFHNIASSATCYLTSFQIANISLPASTGSKIPFYHAVFPKEITFDIFHPPIIA